MSRAAALNALLLGALLSGCVFVVPVEVDASVGGGRAAGGGDAGGDAGGPDAGPDAGISTAIVLSTRLPSPLHEAAVAFDGEVIWLLGGQSSQTTYSRAIHRFDPVTETLTTTSAVLPSARQACGVVTFDRSVYLFGGHVSGQPLSTEILRFDPWTGNITTMSSRLPSGRYNMAVFATSSKIYVLGGGGTGGLLDEVLEFDPLADTLRVVGHLTVGLESPVVAVNGNEAFVFGGRSGLVLPSELPREIDRLDLVSLRVTRTSLRLVASSWQPAPMTIGRLTYLYGGEPLDGVIAFDPSTGRSWRVPGLSVAVRLGRGAVGLSDRGYIFGGMDGATSLLDTIVRFTP